MDVGKRYAANGKPVISYEFFPPRNETAAAQFDKVIDTLVETDPDYVSVTFGAGGSTREGSYQTVTKLIADKKISTVAYIAGFGLGPEDISREMDRYEKLGVETIFVIRGDEPQNEDFVASKDSFQHASSMISYIKDRYPFCLGCAGYPEGHIQAESLEKDIQYLKLKQDNGASYVVAQYCYNNDVFFEYVKKCRSAGVTIPIVPGIMPVYTIGLTKTLSKVCGTTITEGLQKELDRLADADKDSVLAFGVEFATEQCRGLLEQGVPGLHFYTMDRSRSTKEIVSRLRQEGRL